MELKFSRGSSKVSRGSLARPSSPGGSATNLQAHTWYVHQVKILQTSTSGKKCGNWYKKKKSRPSKAKKALLTQ